MNSFVAKLIAFISALVIFVVVWMPIGLLMAWGGGYVAILGLAWGFFCFYVAKKGYNWILDKILRRSDREEVLNIEDVDVSEAKEDQVINSIDIK